MILFISFAKAIVFYFLHPFAKKFRLKFIAYIYTTYSIITKVSFEIVKLLKLKNQTLTTSGKSILLN